MCPEKRLKLILTLGCYFSYFSFAFGFYLVPSTLLDIKDNVNSTFQVVSYGIVVRSIFYCLGALLSKYHDEFKFFQSLNFSTTFSLIRWLVIRYNQPSNWLNIIFDHHGRDLLHNTISQSLVLISVGNWCHGCCCSRNRSGS